MSRRPRGRRAGLTLVEMLFTTLIFLFLFLMVWYFFRAGRSVLDSTERKLDATQITHVRFEHLRHDLERAQWAWAAPADQEHPAADPARRPLEGGPLLVAEGREYFFEAGTGRLLVAGRPTPDAYRDVRFSGQSQFRIQFLLSTDKSGEPGSGKPAFRERSTLLSKVFVEPQAEEHRERNHVWEDDHRWCVQGGSIHYGFRD